MPHDVDDGVRIVVDRGEYHFDGKDLAVGAKMIPFEAVASLLDGDAHQLVRFFEGVTAIGLSGRRELAGVRAQGSLALAT